MDIVSTEAATAREVARATSRTRERLATGKLAQIAWVVTDGAHAPYSSIITMFVFSAYFTTVVVGDPVRGQSLWSYITALAALALAIGAPVIGPIADAGGRVKPWLAGFTLAGIPCLALLWFATPGVTGSGLLWIMAALLGAAISIEYSVIFINALLPRVAARSQIGLLSGLGLMASNISNVLLLLFFLFAWSWNAHPLFGLDTAAHEPQRAAGPLVALWYGLLSLPLLLFTPDAPRTTLSTSQVVRTGLRSLMNTAAKLRQYRNVTMFLIARMIYNEGFIVMMMFTGIFAAGVLHWSATMLVIQGIINSICAAIAGFGAGWLDRKIGSKSSTVIFIVGCLIANLTLCSLTPTSIFFFVELPAAAHSSTALFPSIADKVLLAINASAAFFVTAGFASSRALMAKLSPPHMLNDFFGLYALSGTATSFIGPLAIGILTSVFHNQRAGLAVGVAFFIVGTVILTVVREDEQEPLRSV